jgi:hypothetical protein
LIDSRDNTPPAWLRVRCAWCGATADQRGEVCSSQSDRDLQLHYYSGVSQHWNQEAWQRRRDLFDRADTVLGKEPAL